MSNSWPFVVYFGRCSAITCYVFVRSTKQTSDPKVLKASPICIYIYISKHVRIHIHIHVHTHIHIHRHMHIHIHIQTDRQTDIHTYMEPWERELPGQRVNKRAAVSMDSSKATGFAGWTCDMGP